MTGQVVALKKAGVKAIVISAGPRQASSLVGVAAASRFGVPIIGNNSAYAPQLLATPAAPALEANYYVASPSLPIGADTPLGRAGQPAELAPAYVFLASPRDASYVSGTIIGVTGGRATI